MRWTWTGSFAEAASSAGPGGLASWLPAGPVGLIDGDTLGLGDVEVGDGLGDGVVGLGDGLGVVALGLGEQEGDTAALPLVPALAAGLRPWRAPAPLARDD